MVEWLRRLLQDERQLTQHAVAGVVTLVVVDPLEAVEVDDRQTHRHLLVAPLHDGGIEPLVQGPSVRQTRHGVSRGESLDSRCVVDALDGRAHLGRNRRHPVEVGIDERLAGVPARDEELTPPLTAVEQRHADAAALPQQLEVLAGRRQPGSGHRD